jgi:hypothetical protein
LPERSTYSAHNPHLNLECMRRSADGFKLWSLGRRGCPP